MEIIEQMSKTKYATLSASTVLYKVSKKDWDLMLLLHIVSHSFFGTPSMSIHVLAFEILSITVEITQ